MLGFLRAAEAKDYEKAAQYLDGKRSPQEAQALTDQLKYLLDHGLSTSIDDLSRAPAGNTDDKLRLSRELVGTVTTPTGQLPILLDLVTRSTGPPIWLFSQETLNQVPETYAGTHRVDYGNLFPAWASRYDFLSVPLWRWGAILVSLILVFLIASLLTRVLIWSLPHIFRKTMSAGAKASILALKGPLFFLTLALVELTAGAYALTALGRHYWQSVGVVVAWVSAAWLLVRISDILVNFDRNRLMLRLQVERATFVGLLGRLFKIFVGLILIIFLLQRAGVNVSALITGLGIGGIALALAAQKTLADLFGGLSIVMRGAVRVGDFCQIAGITGTVEDIGISALSLRTLDRSVVSIPNSKVAEANLENFSLRDQFWLHQVFTLRFDAPHDIVKIVLDRIVQILDAHHEIDPTSARARLINLSSTGPQIEVYGYFRRPGADWSVFLALQEDLLLKMMNAIESAGTSLASPVGVVQLQPEKGPDTPPDSR